MRTSFCNSCHAGHYVIPDLFRDGIAFLLVESLCSFGNGEQICFLERLANPLQTDWEATCHTARNAHARETGEVQANGVDVREVNCHRVGFVHAALERETRHRRTCNHVASLECFGEVVRDEATDLLSLDVVSVVEACGKNVATEEDSALDFLAECFAAGLCIKVEELACFGAAVTVTDTVIAAEVGACFCRCNDVVAGHGVANVREAYFLDRGAFGFHLLKHVFDSGFAFCVETFAKVFLRNADDLALHARAELCGKVFVRAGARGVVVRVNAANCAEKRCAIANGRAEWTNLVERTCVGEEAVT